MVVFLSCTVVGRIKKKNEPWTSKKHIHNSFLLIVVDSVTFIELVTNGKCDEKTFY